MVLSVATATLSGHRIRRGVSGGTTRSRPRARSSRAARGRARVGAGRRSTGAQRAPSTGRGWAGKELLAGYQPPDLSGGPAPTAYAYDLDKALTQVSQPGGTVIDYAYDAAGRVQFTTFPTGEIERAYDPATGQLTSLSGPTGVDLSFTYDGKLRTSTSWSGLVAGASSGSTTTRSA